MPTATMSTAGAHRENALRELNLFVGKTIELASAGKPYQEVIQHIGALSAEHRKALKNGEGAASLYPASALFSEMTFYLGRGSDRIVSMEFIANKGAFDMDDLRAAFGEWHRSPAEPEQASFAVAWFPQYDQSTGAKLFLYAEDGDYAPRIDAGKTPARLFFQADHFRWDET
jgi:hypothetical protein